MSDTIIHDSTPAGSVILAYGETSSSSPKSSRRFIIFATIIAIIACFVSVFLLICTSKLPLPRHTLAMVYVRTDTPLPDWNPGLWKEIQIRARPFPILVGWQRNQDGTAEPFAITLRTYQTQQPTSKTFFWQRVSSITDEQPASLVSLSSSWTDYFYPAWLHIWPEAFHGTEHVEGPMKKNAWETRVSVSKTQARDNILGPNALDLTSFPALWPMLQVTLKNQGFEPLLSSTPTRLSWARNESGALSLAFDFETEPNSSTKAELAAGFGIYEKNTYRLPDGTVATERRLPYTLFQNATTTAWRLDNGNILLFDKQRAIFGNPELFSSPASSPSCDGNIIALFDQHTLQTFFRELQIPVSPHFFNLRVVENKGRVVACWL